MAPKSKVDVSKSKAVEKPKRKQIFLVPTAKKLCRVAGFTRTKHTLFPYVASRMENDFKKLAAASFLMARSKKIRPGDVVAAAKELGFGNVEVSCKMFRRAKKRSKKVEVPAPQ